MIILFLYIRKNNLKDIRSIDSRLIPRKDSDLLPSQETCRIFCIFLRP